MSALATSPNINLIKIAEVLEGGSFKSRLEREDGTIVSATFNEIYRLEGQIDGKSHELYVANDHGRRSVLIENPGKGTFEEKGARYGSIEFDTSTSLFIAKNGVANWILDPSSGLPMNREPYHEIFRDKSGALRGTTAGGEVDVELVAPLEPSEQEGALNETCAPASAGLFRQIREDHGFRIFRDSVEKLEYLVGKTGERISNSYNRIEILIGSIAGEDAVLAVGEKGGVRTPLSPDDLTKKKHLYFQEISYRPELRQFVAVNDGNQSVINHRTGEPAHKGAFRSFRMVSATVCIGVTSDNRWHLLDTSPDNALSAYLNRNWILPKPEIKDIPLRGRTMQQLTCQHGRPLSSVYERISVLQGRLYDGREVSIHVGHRDGTQVPLVPFRASYSESGLVGRKVAIVEPGVPVVETGRNRFVPFRAENGVPLNHLEFTSFKKGEDGSLSGSMRVFAFTILAGLTRTWPLSEPSLTAEPQASQMRPRTAAFIDSLNYLVNSGFYPEVKDGRISMKDMGADPLNGQFDYLEAIALNIHNGSPSHIHRSVIVGFREGAYHPLLFLQYVREGGAVQVTRYDPKLAPALKDLYFDTRTGHFVGGDGINYQLLDCHSNMQPLHTGSFERFEPKTAGSEYGEYVSAIRGVRSGRKTNLALTNLSPHSGYHVS